MTFRSKAQRRKFAELLVKGEISDEVYERWNRDTGSAELPERVGPSSGRTSKAGKKSATLRKKTTRKQAARKRAARSS